MQAYIYRQKPTERDIANADKGTTRNDKTTVRVKPMARLWLEDLELFLAADREGVRVVLAKTFNTMCKTKVLVRFDDECEYCGTHMDQGTFCNNPECDNAFPSECLKELMDKNPYHQNEAASVYLRRLTDLWRRQQSK